MSAESMNAEVRRFEIFEFQFPGEEPMRWNVTSVHAALVMGVLDGAPGLCNLKESWPYVGATNQFNRAYAASLGPGDLNRTLLGVTFPDGNSILIDGVHRMAAGLRLGYEHLPMCMFTFEELKPYML